jgi:hypothetical protein
MSTTPRLHFKETIRKNTMKQILLSGGRIYARRALVTPRELPLSIRPTGRAVRSLSSSLLECTEADRRLILKQALQPQTSVSLQALMRTGKGEYLHKTFGESLPHENYAATELVLIQVAGFLRRELPIRLAHRIQDLEGIPVLRDMATVKEVRNLYIKSFNELVTFDTKIQTGEQEAAFATIVENIYERHSNVLVQMARGAFEFRQAVRQEKGHEFELEEETHDFLDRFYLCRIGIRVLIGQYLALRQPPVENYIGIICSKTSPYQIVKRAIGKSGGMCLPFVSFHRVATYLTSLLASCSLR